MKVVINKTKNQVISSSAMIADDFFSRMQGLLGRTALLEDESLIITKCNSIHMFFMKFAIDVIFMDKNDSVVGIIENIKPFQLSPIFFKASYVIELPVGAIQKGNVFVGDELEIN